MTGMARQATAAASAAGSRRRSTAQQPPCLQVQRAELIQRDGAAAVAVVQPHHLCAMRANRHVSALSRQAASAEPPAGCTLRVPNALLGCCCMSPGQGAAWPTCEQACRLKCRPPSAIARCSSSALMVPVRSVSMAWMQEVELGGECGRCAGGARTGSSGGCAGVPRSCAAEPHRKPLLYLLLQLRHDYRYRLCAVVVCRKRAWPGCLQPADSSRDEWQRRGLAAAVSNSGAPPSGSGDHTAAWLRLWRARLVAVWRLEQRTRELGKRVAAWMRKRPPVHDCWLCGKGDLHPWRVRGETRSPRALAALLVPVLSCLKCCLNLRTRLG